MTTLSDFQAQALTGEEVDLGAFEGKVVLVVNTASQCGLTPQFEGLEKLYKAYHPRGLAVLGFPSNDFLHQDPGTNQEIGAYCTQNYGVTFDMFEKIVVKGWGQAPLYQYLTEKATNPAFAGDIGWNFTKFLVGRDGKVLARYKSEVTPEDAKLVSALEAALKQKQALGRR